MTIEGIVKIKGKQPVLKASLNYTEIFRLATLIPANSLRRPSFRIKLVLIDLMLMRQFTSQMETASPFKFENTRKETFS